MADAERQLQVEGAQRARVGAAAVLGGLLFFGGQVLITLIGAKEKSIGILQGLAPAFNGQAAAHVDPRTVHEQFLVHYQWSLMGGFVISCVGVLLMIFPLRYLGAAEELRSSAPSPIGRYAAIGGPVLYGIFLPAFELSLILGAHSYLSGHARTGSAIDAATGGGLRVAFQLILTIGTLLLAVGFIMVSLRSMRVGLLTRMMGTVGIIAGVLFLIPITPLPVIQALWLIFLGAMHRFALFTRGVVTVFLAVLVRLRAHVAAVIGEPRFVHPRAIVGARTIHAGIAFGTGGAHAGLARSFVFVFVAVDRLAPFVTYLAGRILNGLAAAGDVLAGARNGVASRQRDCANGAKHCNAVFHIFDSRQHDRGTCRWQDGCMIGIAAPAGHQWPSETGVGRNGSGRALVCAVARKKR